MHLSSLRFILIVMRQFLSHFDVSRNCIIFSFLDIRHLSHFLLFCSLDYFLYARFLSSYFLWCHLLPITLRFLAFSVPSAIQLFSFICNMLDFFTAFLILPVTSVIYAEECKSFVKM